MAEIPYNDLLTSLIAKKFRVPERVDYCTNGDRIIIYSDGNQVRIPKGEVSSDLIRYENQYNSVPVRRAAYNTGQRERKIINIDYTVDENYRNMRKVRWSNGDTDRYYPNSILPKEVLEYENEHRVVKYSGQYGKTFIIPATDPTPPKTGDFIMKSDSTYGVALDNADTNGVVNVLLTNNGITTINLTNQVNVGYDLSKNTYYDDNNNQICTEEEIMNGTISRAQAEALMAQAAKALEIVNERDKKFGEDIYNDGDILYADVKWCKREDTVSESVFKRQRIYKYAFIKAGNVWYSSGPRSGGVQFTWDQLVNFLSQRYLVRFGGVTRQKARVRKDKVVV